MPVEKIIATVIPVTKGPLHHFFGYYDKCPWDRSGRYLLAMQNAFADRNPTPDDALTVGRVDLESDMTFEPVATTLAWNWQQGCMLRWLSPLEENVILFNHRRGGRYVAVCYDLGSRETTEMDWPIYDLASNGRGATSLNFARWTDTRPGYGYWGLPDPFAIQSAPEDDGLYTIDMVSRKRRLIFTLKDSLKVGKMRPEAGCKSWFSVPKLNPGGTRIFFLHRWGSAAISGHTGFTNRALTIGADGSDPACLLEGGNVSHFDWYDDETIVVWLDSQPSLPDGYYAVHDPSGECRPYGQGLLLDNGHCSFSPDRRWMLTDTYPLGPDNEQRLILYNPEDHRRVDVGSFSAMPVEDLAWRCDLHPRWNRDGTQVCIDSTHEGTRQMYVIDVSRITTP